MTQHEAQHKLVIIPMERNQNKNQNILKEDTKTQEPKFGIMCNKEQSRV